MPDQFQSESSITRILLGSNTLGQRREDIFKKLQTSAEKCVTKYANRKELATDKDESVADLCEALEDTFSYGLRQQQSNVAASLFQSMHEIVTGSYNNNDVTFWDFCLTHLTIHEQRRYEKLKQVWTKIGKGRAFIRSALNEHSLGLYVLTWLDNETMLQRFYTPWSLLLNEEATKELPNILKSLNFVLFALNVDMPELNASRRESVGTSAAESSKKEPIIYAPNPVPVADIKQKRKVNVIERPIVSASSTEDLLKSLKLKESLEVQQLTVNEFMNSFNNLEDPIQQAYTTPIDPIESELEFLKTPLADTYAVDVEEEEEEQQQHKTSTDQEIINNEHEQYDDTSDTSSQYSKSSMTANQTALEQQVRELTEYCALLETRVAELSLQNRQLVRRLTVQFNESGIDPSSSFCANFLITIPQAKLVKTSHSSQYYTYEVHITMRQRLEHWSMFRRYRDFYKLHKTLLRTHPTIAAVQFPPKKHFGNMNLVFVEERRQQLQIYLLNLVEMLPQVEACKTKADLQKVFPFFRER